MRERAVSPLETLLAIKALNLEPSLTANDRRVGTVLIEHFNRRDNRCDPSVKRIAQLLSVCLRTVIRSTGRLERAGLFRKVRHGGLSNRNSYEPVWERFVDIQERWTQQMRPRNGPAEESPASGKESHPESDNPVPQTLRANLTKQTCLQGLPGKENGLSHGYSFNAKPAGQKSAEAARVAAERRWTNDIHQAFSACPITYAEIIEAIDEPAREGATDAELKRPGAGISYLRTLLKLSDQLSSRPP